MIDSLHGILHGLMVAGQPINLLYTLIGVFIGTMISHLPGIGPSAGIALLIPITFGMNPTTALIMLAGIYYGCMYGGAVTAILINTPGDAAAVMTTLDGYPLARQGRAGAALSIAAMSSFIAGTLGVTALTFVAVPVAQLALSFGPTEYFALMVFALSTVSALTGDSLAKGLLSTSLGLAISCVGLDLQSGRSRFTMGIVDLQQGVSFLVVVVGVFALAEVARMAEGTLEGTMHSVRVKGRIWFTRQDWKEAFPAILRGWGVGFFCGAAPGLGGTISAMLSYVLEKHLSKTPEKFGKGAIEGVAGPEAAVNADTCGAFVHLLALGIPASGSTAVIMGAFIMYGIQPGPLLFQSQPDLVWGLIASMYVGNVMLLVLNLPLVGLFARVLYAPPGVLLVMILGIASVGVYSFETNPFMLYMALLFGVVGHFFRKLDIPKAPLIFGIILGGKIEQSLRQAMTISSGDAMVFLESPLSATLLAFAVGMVALSFWAKRKSAATLQQVQEQAKTQPVL
jgi:putative tricarboxylic transport membrane protein